MLSISLCKHQYGVFRAKKYMIKDKNDRAGMASDFNPNIPTCRSLKKPRQGNNTEITQVISTHF